MGVDEQMSLSQVASMQQCELLAVFFCHLLDPAPCLLLLLAEPPFAQQHTRGC